MIGYGTNIVRNGLVLHLDAANPKSYPGSGTTWYDLSGYNRNAILTNGPTYNSDNKGSMLFDGINDYAVVDTNVYYTYQKEITVSCWLLFNSFNYILSQAVKNSDTMANNVWLWHAATNGFSWYVNNNGSWVATSISSLSTGVWYFITTVANSSNLFIYKNNELAVNTPSGVSTQILNSPNSQIATNDHRYATSRPPHYGKISTIQIYNRALSSAEIAQNFEATRGRYSI